MERILNMILRRLLNKGMNSGINALAKRGRGADQDGAKDSPEDRKLSGQARQNARSLRQGAKVIKRLNRF